MNKFNLVLVLFVLSFLCSCNSMPSDDDIKKKILIDYICNGTAKVSSLKIVDKKDAESIMGLKGYEFLATGEVLWESGCQEFGSRIPPCFTESLDKKRVVLIKSDEGWQ